MKTKQILELLKILSWVIFIGLCIKAGAIIISFAVSLFINTEAAKDLYLGLNLSQLNDYSNLYYICIVSFIITIALLKAYLFYLVIKIFKTINFHNPFNVVVGNLISKISYYAVVIAIIAIIANSYSDRLVKKGINFNVTWGSSEFLFMAGLLYIIAVIFKRGIEIQQENELTI